MGGFTTHTLYENFVLEAKLTDLLNTKLATRSLMTIDNSLSENVGMKKNINTYTYAGAVEKMATLGSTNTVRGVLSYCSWVSEKVNWLVDKLAFWRSGQSEMDGSHRTGLREVPYDGYVAELHKGEMVLTAYEAKQYQKQGSFASGGTQSNTNITVNNYSPKALNEAESARQFKKAQRELALGVA